MNLSNSINLNNDNIFNKFPIPSQDNLTRPKNDNIEINNNQFSNINNNKSWNNDFYPSLNTNNNNLNQNQFKFNMESESQKNIVNTEFNNDFDNWDDF